MTHQEELLINIVSAWNKPVAEQLAEQFGKYNATSSSGSKRDEDLKLLLNMALSNIERRPEATRANLDRALKLLS